MGRTNFVYVPHVGRLLLLLVIAGCEAPVMPGEPTITEGRPPPKQPPPFAVGGFQVEMPAYTLEAGDERTPCWILPLEIMGSSRMVGGATLTVGPGMHHGNVVTRPKTGEGIRKCKGAESGADSQVLDIANGGAVLFGSSTQFAGQEWQSFPEGMAYRIRDNFEIVARMHYLNASSQPLTVAP